MLTLRQLERLSDVNPFEALPRGTRRPVRRAARVQIAGEHTDLFRDKELFRMRTRPELYEDWMRDLIEDARADLAISTGQYDWDCHSCHTAVMTYSLTDRCPRCGA